MSWQTIHKSAVHSVAVYADRLAALAADRQSVLDYGGPTVGWTKIGGPARRLIGGGDNLFALSPDGSEIWRYLGIDESWERIGGPGLQFVGVAETVYRLSLTRTAVACWERTPDKWRKVGGPASRLVPGGDHLYALSPDGSQLWRYSGDDQAWEHIGDGGADFAGVADTVYRLPADKSAVFRWEREPHKWTKIGGPAKRLIGGGDVLCAVGTDDGLWLYTGSGNTWTKVGGPGAAFVKSASDVYRVGRDNSVIDALPLLTGESSRLASEIEKAFAAREYGSLVTRGFLVQRVGGPVLAQRRSRRSFQPLSTLKLLPYLHALIEVDKTPMTLEEKVTWPQPTVDDPDTDFDDRLDEPCLEPGTPGSVTGEAALGDALPTMMWESHGRTLEALFDKFGPDKITRRAQDDLGLLSTRMYFGCSNKVGEGRNWPWNRSTLHEIGRMFEGVELLQFVDQPATREQFFALMINRDYAGVSYTSPITNRSQGARTTGFLREVIEDEAIALGKSSQVVEPFLSEVRIREKGGGGGPSGGEQGFSVFRHVSVPFKVDGKIVPHSFLVGWYLYPVRWPAGCEGSQPCMDRWEENKDILEDFTRTIHRLPIRQALATW